MTRIAIVCKPSSTVKSRHSTAKSTLKVAVVVIVVVIIVVVMVRRRKKNVQFQRK